MKASIPKVLFAVFLLTTLAWAQLGRGEISGTVQDATNAVIPGAEVTATFSSTGQVRSAVSDDSGRFRINNLAVGIWEVKVELTGFNTLLFETVAVSSGQVTELDIELAVASVAQTVTVSGATTPVVQTGRSEISGAIEEVQIRDLPMLGRNWLGYAQLAPGVKSDGSEAGSDATPTAGLGIGRQDRVVLDGTDLNNRSTSATADIKVSKEAIAEFEVKTNQFDAQNGQSGTSITSAVTKSGTDQFHGNAYYFFRDDSLNADDFFNATNQPFQNTQYGGSIGGPIVRGKTHFFFNYERQEEPKTVQANTGFAALDEPVDGSENRNLWFVRVDHSFTDNHQLSGRYNRYDRFLNHSGVGGRTVPSASFINDFEIDRYSFALNSVFSNQWVNQFTVAFLDTGRLFGPIPGAGPRHDFPSVSIGAAAGGGFEQPDHWSFRDDLSILFNKGGEHNFKVGGYGEIARLEGFFLFGVPGFFSYDQDPANLATCCGSETQADWDKSQFPIPTGFFQTLGDPGINSPNRIASWYIQDDWKIHPRVTLNLGLRYDLEFGSLANNLDMTLLQEPFSNDTNNFQPRVGVAIDLTGQRKTYLRAAAGKFFSQAFLNVTFFVERTNRTRQLSVSIPNTNNDPGFANNPLGGLTFEDFRDRIGDPNFPLNLAIFDTDARQPSMASYSVGFAHSFSSSLALKVDLVHQRSDDQLRSIDQNLICCLPDGNAFPVVDVNVGDPAFFELGGTFSATARPDARWGNVRLFKNNGIARYTGLQASLERRFTDNLSFGFTYLLSSNESDFDDVFQYPSNNFDLEDEYNDSVLDQDHRFTTNWVAQLPYGFSFSGLLFASSNRPIGTSGGTISTGGLDIFGVRPESRGRSQRPTCGLDPRFNGACASIGVPNGTRVPRNGFRSDSVFRVDVRLSNKFRFGTERIQLEPSIEIFNVFNRENYDPSRFNGSLGSGGFGSPGRSSALPYLPRQIQLGIRFAF